MTASGWLIAVSMAAIAGFVRGFSGFGSVMVLTPSLGILFGPQQAIATALLLETAASVRLLPGAVQQTRWREILPMACIASLMVPLGAYLLIVIRPDLMQRIVAGVIIGFVALLMIGKRVQEKPGLSALISTGVMSGILTGATGMGGPPIVLYQLSGPAQAKDSRANFITFFGLTQIVAVAAYWASGIVSTPVLWSFAGLIPSFAIGLMVGSRFFGKTSDRLFRQLVLGFLLAIAVISFLI